MQSSSYGLPAIAITADDQVSPVLASINRAITQFRRSVADAGLDDTRKGVDRITGATARLETMFKRGPLAPFRRELKELRTGAVEAADAIGKVFTPLSGLAAATSLAGVGAAMNSFARRGSGVGLTSRQLAMNPRDFQRLSGAADLANAPAGAASTAMTGLNAAMRAAAFEGNAEMLGVFKQLGFGDKLLNPDGSLVSPTEMFHRLLPALAKIRDPRARMAAEQKLGITDLDALIAKGPSGVRDLEDQALRHSGLTDDEIAKADELRKAFTALEQSVSGFGDKLASVAAGPMTQALTGMSNWLDKAKETPEVMKAAEIGFGVLATAIGANLALIVARFTAANAAILATPLGKAILAGAGAYEGLKFLFEHSADALLPHLSPGDLFRRSKELQNGDSSGGFIDWLRGFFGGSGSGAGGASSPGGAGPGTRDILREHSAMSGEAGDPRGMEAAIRAAAIRYGHNPDIAMRVARSEGLANYIGDNGTSFGAFQLHVGGGLGDRFQRDTGLDPRDPKNELAMIDWSMKHLSETGWGPYHGASRFAGVGLREGIGASGSRLNRGFLVPPGTKFNSRGEPYSDSLDTMSPQEKANVAASMAWIKSHMGQPDAWGASSPGEGPKLDSPISQPAPADNKVEGHVLFEFRNAPAGMRGGIRNFAGPLDATVRVVSATGLA